MTDATNTPPGICVEDTCATCRFFVKHEPGHVYGDCHRLPPQFGFYANIYEPDSYGSTRRRIDITRERGGVWPNVSQDEWCGEHQPARLPSDQTGRGEA